MQPPLLSIVCIGASYRSFKFHGSIVSVCRVPACSVDKKVILRDIRLVQKRDCRAEFILSAREGLAMKKSSNNAPNGVFASNKITIQLSCLGHYWRDR
jgi:hypothetical protein